MKTSELFEAPPLHTFPTEFGLDDQTKNGMVAKEWLKEKNKIALEKFDNGRYTLYELPRAFIMVDYVDQHNPKLVYSMKFKLVFHKFIGRQCAQQIAVWRDMLCPSAEGVASHIFFDHLLKNIGAVITDAMQTDDGKKFWDKRIGEAIGKGLNVYYVNLLPNRVVKQITTTDQYRQITRDTDIWGDEAKHMARRIIITEKPL